MSRTLASCGVSLIFFLASSAELLGCGGTSSETCSGDCPRLTTTSSSATSSSSGGGSHAGTGGGGTGGSSTELCEIPAPGTTFTFHVHNAGTNMLTLNDGCGTTSPITLDTPSGVLGLGAGNANGCGFTCEDDYKGPVQTECSDCGPGEGAALAPGDTVDIPWDRRVYQEHTAAASCVGGMSDIACALAVRVAETAAQVGTISVCPMDQEGAAAGFCSGTPSKVTFTADTTTASTTIDVM